MSKSAAVFYNHPQVTFSENHFQLTPETVMGSTPHKVRALLLKLWIWSSLQLQRHLNYLVIEL